MHEPEDESKDLHGDLYDTLCGVHYLPVPRHSREGHCGFDHFIIKNTQKKDLLIKLKFKFEEKIKKNPKISRLLNKLRMF